ncbi:MAG: hypothetical protein R3Y61_04500 [Rikenellaceae bacterium]
MENISKLKHNIDRLVGQVEKLKEQNRILQARVVAAEARASRSQEKAEELQTQLTSSLLTSTITEVAGGTKAAKQRINRLIKDIDKCIAMSSK